MSQIELIALAFPASFLVLLLIEALIPARPLPKLPGWRALGIAMFVLMVAVGTLLPLLIPAHWVEQYGLLDLSWLGPFGGFAVGWAAYTLVGYAWHRAAHAFAPLWRGFHQLHHAPTRFDVASSMIFHPTELVVYTLLSVGTSAFVLGLHPVAAAMIGTWGGVVSVLQHANLRTPRWMGPFVQRPESHSLHHAVGGPVGNYSDLPLWDMLFGTYHNPESFGHAVGFDNGGERRWLAMLAFQDVSKAPRTEPAAWTADRHLDKTRAA